LVRHRLGARVHDRVVGRVAVAVEGVHAVVQIVVLRPPAGHHRPAAAAGVAAHVGDVRVAVEVRPPVRVDVGLRLAGEEAVVVVENDVDAPIEDLGAGLRVARLVVCEQVVMEGKLAGGAAGGRLNQRAGRMGENTVGHGAVLQRHQVGLQVEAPVGAELG
jgi:hypothetical protein